MNYSWFNELNKKPCKLNLFNGNVLGNFMMRQF